MWTTGCFGFLLCSLLIVEGVNSQYIREKSLRRFRNQIAGEPSCEDLRVMWRFSRRQGRVAEITNEIPTYPDPFALNVWGEYRRSRGSGIQTLRSVGRKSPIYGRIVQNAPKYHPRLANIEKVLRYMDETDFRNTPTIKPPVSAFRLTGRMTGPSALTQDGSFQHLKQLIWAEREKELQQQRLLEAEALKHVKVPSHLSRAYNKQRGSAFYLPQPMELAYPRPRYSMNGPTYRKSYRYQPTYDYDEDTRNVIW